MPDLVGVEQSQAHALAARHGFVMRWMSYVGRLSNGHTNVKCVKVFSQSPVAGERRAIGAQISVLEIACHTPTGRWHDAAGVSN
ncbi:MAG: PASTA domain-containing protein [Solirubrobacteraceae bacterium]